MGWFSKLKPKFPGFKPPGIDGGPNMPMGMPSAPDFGRGPRRPEKPDLRVFDKEERLRGLYNKKPGPDILDPWNDPGKDNDAMGMTGGMAQVPEGMYANQPGVQPLQPMEPQQPMAEPMEPGFHESERNLGARRQFRALASREEIDPNARARLRALQARQGKNRLF
jgi:hypothetical protein